MCSWNQHIIEKNIERIRKLLLKCKNKDEIMRLTRISHIYQKIDKITDEVIKREGDNYIYPLRNLSESTNSNDVYHSSTMDRVSIFLMSFNPDYYEEFSNMKENGLISLHKNEDGIVSSEHFIDDVNNCSFIYVSSNDFENESEELIGQFGYVYQAMYNDYDESNILFLDAFPDYLKMSMRYYYDNSLKDEIIDDMAYKNQLLFDSVDSLDKNIQGYNKKKKEYAKKIASNYLALFMFLNNDIEYTFDNVDKFIENNNISSNSRILWNIANGNIEGIDHIKQIRQ